MDSVWLKNYPAGVPATINPDQYPSVAAMFADSVAKYPRRPMVKNLGTQLTYQQMDALSGAVAAYLQQKLRMKKGQRLAIMMPNLIQYVVMLFAAFKAGLIVVNVNPLYTVREVVDQLQDAEADAIVVVSNFASTIQAAKAQLTLKHILITDIGDAFSPVKSGLVNFAVKYIKKMVPAYHLPEAIRYRDMIKEGRHLKLVPVVLTGSDLAFLQYTGGTTGKSKGAMLSHRNMVANIEQAFHWIAPFIECGQEVVVTPLPLYHIFSLLANLLVFTRAGSMNLLITNPRDVKGFVKTLKTERFTGMTGVNTLFNALVNHPSFAGVDFSQMKFVLGGGMAVQSAVAEKWQKMTGIHILEAYGLTETCPAVTINPLNLHRYNGSIGLPIPSTKVKVVDDAGEELPLGTAGELSVQGPQVMTGYWNMPEETAKVMLPDGWLRTGDMAKIDENGFVYIVDRKKDMVVVSGFNVYPNEVEEILTKHPAVLEAAVIGVPHAHSGEALKAFIVAKAAVEPGELRTFCHQYLTNYKIPKLFEFKSELPKSNVGKILRRELREIPEKSVTSS